MRPVQSTQVMPPTQHPPVIAMVQPGNDNVLHSYASQTSIALGITQVICGGFCIIFQIAAILLNATAMQVGTGIWCGALFVVAGGLSIASGKYRTKCLVIGAMVTSIVSAVFCICLLSISSVGIAIDHDDYSYSRYDSYSGEYTYISADEEHSRIAMNAVLVVFAIIEAAVAIWQACICCKPVCCVTSSGSHQVMYSTGSGGVTTGQLPNGQQVILLNNIGQHQAVMQQHTGPAVMQVPYQGNMIMMPVSSLHTQQNISQHGQPFVQQNMGMIQQQTQPVIVQAPQYQQQQMPSPPPQYIHISNPQVQSGNNQAEAAGTDLINLETNATCGGEKKEAL